ncbi:MAG: hypothetical protein NZM42_14740, partial [Gemmatales bacterium]|nr:hypothetical protein [Gemmatales bacterium]MDW8224360.1 hypothetical protein [Gemmatales bacterium]
MSRCYRVGLVLVSAVFLAVLAVAQQGDVPEKPVKLRALATLEARREGCDKHYINLAMSADGKRLYAVARWEYANTPPPPVPFGQLECWERTEDGAKLVWSADVTERLVSLPTRILALSPDNKHLALGLSDRVVVFDTANGKPVRELLPDMPDGVTDRVIKALAFSPDGRALAGSYWGQKIHVWDFASGKTLKAWQAFDVGCNQILTMRFLESGNVLAITGNYHRVAFYDWQQARQLSAWEVRDLKDEKSTTRYVYDFEIARCGDKTYWVSAHGDSMRGAFFDAASEGYVEVRDAQG